MAGGLGFVAFLSIINLVLWLCQMIHEHYTNKEIGSLSGWSFIISTTLAIGANWAFIHYLVHNLGGR